MSIIKPFIKAHGLETTLEKFVIVPITDVVQQMPGRCVGDPNLEYRRLMWKGFVYASMFDVPVYEYTGLSPSGTVHRLWRDYVIERKE
jgi:hypothetical protein